MSPAKRRSNSELQAKIDSMRLTIAPIVHVETGLPPPEFPDTMLKLFLLTEDQLDSMAKYYCQSDPNEQTLMYPQTMDWNRPMLAKTFKDEPDTCRLSDLERLKIKMRMFARFIGMRGAETPSWEYDRQIEILSAQIEKAIEEEERLENHWKWYKGPPQKW